MSCIVEDVGFVGFDLIRKKNAWNLPVKDIAGFAKRSSAKSQKVGGKTSNVTKWL